MNTPVELTRNPQTVVGVQWDEDPATLGYVRALIPTLPLLEWPGPGHPLRVYDFDVFQWREANVGDWIIREHRCLDGVAIVRPVSAEHIRLHYTVDHIEHQEAA